MNIRKLLASIILLSITAIVCSYAWWPPATLRPGIADKVVVFKSRREMVLFRDGRELCRYRVSLGRSPVGRKTRAGDHKTPEGDYSLDSKNPSSGFHLAMNVSYPNSVDRERAAREGVDPGGLIMVHGIKNGLGWLGRLHRLADWTDGCIALTNPEMDQFYALVPTGTPIDIQP